VKAVEGHDAQLWCVNTAVVLDIGWWKHVNDRIVYDGDVQPGFEDRMSFNRTNGILTIRKVTTKDNDVYWCTYNGGFAEVEIHLKVFGKFTDRVNFISLIVSVLTPTRVNNDNLYLIWQPRRLDYNRQ